MDGGGVHNEPFVPRGEGHRSALRSRRKQVPETGEIKGVNGFFDLVPGRVYFVPQGGRITNAVMLEADTKGTAAVALVCEVGVDTVLIRVENLSMMGRTPFQRKK